MRIGNNPQRDKEIDLGDFFHQIIIPVYIPNQEEYYKESFEVFKLSMQSLIKTSHNKTFISIISNGCCREVNEYILELYNQNKIHEITITKAIGKLNSILKGISGLKFPLVTITDADVLFLENWQKATYDVFEAFPKVGYVSTTPSSKTLKQNTENLIVDHLFNPKLRFTQVKEPEALREFANSIGNPDFYNKFHLEKYLTLESDSEPSIRCVVGASHFVGTYRREVFDTGPKYSNYALGGSSESLILDVPVVKNGFYRVATEKNYTYHMGNVLTKKYLDIFEKQNSENHYLNDVNFLRFSKSKNYILKKKIFNYVVSKKKRFKIFLKYKGLNEEAISNY